MAFVVILFVSAEFSVAQAPWAGSGDVNDPYQIRDANDVNALAEDPNYYSAHFKLMANVDMSGFSYSAAVIARNGSPSFTGVFDGDGYKIANLTIDTGGANNRYLGLFGSIDTGASIKKLGIVNVTITGGSSSEYVGGLAGMNNNSTISKCYSTGVVSGGSKVGGLVGYNVNRNGNISKCYSTASVFGTYEVGGLGGSNQDGYVSESYATGQVSGSTDVGGLLGRNDSMMPMDGLVSQCYSSGRVLGDQSPGGLIGYSLGGNCSQSYWDKWTSGQTYSAGGSGKTTPEMKKQASYSGWDFVDTWFIIEDVIRPIHSWAPTVYKGDLNLDGEVNFFDFSIMAGHWLK